MFNDRAQNWPSCATLEHIWRFRRKSFADKNAVKNSESEAQSNMEKSRTLTIVSSLHLVHRLHELEGWAWRQLLAYAEK